MSAEDGGGSACANADTVATLVQLYNAAAAANKLGRKTRAVELYERAAAAAEASSLPRDSLITAVLLDQAVLCRGTMASVAAAAQGAARDEVTESAAWRSDARLLAGAVTKNKA
jgi:hypothetical protein